MPGLVISYGKYTCCLTCRHRRRWSTGKTCGAYCLRHSRGGGPRITRGVLGWRCDMREPARDAAGKETSP